MGSHSWIVQAHVSTPLYRYKSTSYTGSRSPVGLKFDARLHAEKMSDSKADQFRKVPGRVRDATPPTRDAPWAVPRTARPQTCRLIPVSATFWCPGPQ